MGDVAKGIKSFKKGMASDVTDEESPKIFQKIKTPIIKIQVIKNNSNATNWLV